MNKNHEERHGMLDKLARDSKVPRGSKQSHVNVARVRGKLPNLIRGGLPEGGQKSAAAIVVGGVTTTQGGRGNSSTGRRAKRQGVEQKEAGKPQQPTSGWKETRAVTERRLKAGRKHRRRKGLSERMEKEMVQHEEVGLWECIFSRSNLFLALERVQANGGAPGVDGMTVEELPEHLKVHWPSIREKLEAGTYQPSPVRRVEIPKPSRGVPADDVAQFV